MAGIIRNSTRKPFIRIVGGEMVRTVEEDTKGARLRKYELPNGVKGEKWELVYNGWSGKIKNISISETDYGTVCEVDIDDAVLVLNTNSSYFNSFATKLLNIDFSKPLEIYPFDFLNDQGKKVVGLSIIQGGNKLENYYYNPKTKTYGKGYPKVDEKAKNRLKKNYWKVFFAEVEAFLLSEVDKVISENFNTLVNSLSLEEIVEGIEEPSPEVKDEAKKTISETLIKKEGTDTYMDKKELEKKSREESIDEFLTNIEKDDSDLPF